MKVTKKIDLDLGHSGVRPRIDVVQGDTIRQIEARLFNNGVPWVVPENVTVAVGFRKQDGKRGLYDTLPDGTAAVTVDGNVATVVIAPQALTATGVTSMNILFHDPDLNQLRTFPFDVIVFENLSDGYVSNEFYKYQNIYDINRALVEHDSALGNLIDDWSMDESGFLYLLAGDTVVIGPIGPFTTGGGGGGGNAPSYTVTLSNLLPSRVIIVPEGTPVSLLLKYTSEDSDGMDDGLGVGQLLVGGITRKTFSVPQGEFPVDITAFLGAGTNNIAVKVTNSENITKTMTYTVTVAAVSLTSSFDPLQEQSGSFLFPYTPVGIAEKTMHFELDGVEIGTAKVTSSGRQQSFSIPAQAHGAHVLRVWFTCTIEGTGISSNVLYYSIICIEAGNNTPIIALTTPPLASVEQFANSAQRYRVYDPAGLTAAIMLEANGDNVGSLTVDRTEQTWSYQPTAVGELVRTIRCGDTYVSWTSTVTESSIKVEAETEALALHLSSYGRSNNEENPGVWENSGVSTIFKNFNFASDGWLQDEDDITVLRVTGDARLEIPYKPFASNFTTTGKTLEFELTTRDVLDYDATVLSCYSGGRGFVVTAQQLYFNSSLSSLSGRYKENEHFRVSIVVEKKSENRFILLYINGIMSGSVQYLASDDFADDFSQAAPVNITIGSNDCTVDLYNIRVYDNSLTRYQVLDNWIADTRNIDEKLARYKRNNIYDVYGQVVIEKLPSDLPYMVISAAVLPQFKGDKKTCSGYFVDPMNPKRNFTFSGTQIDVQGTSSADYYRKNYKMKFKEGFVLNDGTLVESYRVNDNAVPTNTFTMKADVASSEGAFNVVLSMLYNDLCPYKTPAQVADPKVRQCIEGFPMVIFWDDGTGAKFLGKYNFNNDKGTSEVFGFQQGDESWETRQNGTARVGWHSADYSGSGWKDDFEARYPEDNVDTTRLQALAQWLVTTDTDQATGSALPQAVTFDGQVEFTHDTAEYRLAKFSAELADHFVEDAVIFYYLFTEIMLSIDQREKNAFPTYLKDQDRWIVLFYDADSSLGTDNKGGLTFDYYLEDIDYTQGGDPVYNGQNSVLWKNLRATRYDEIMAMYQQLRVDGLISYDIVAGKFETHQSKWPEAIFNEDMHIKCLEPMILAGDNRFLSMLQGKKEMWIKWWLYNRFRYLDSKYSTGTSMTNRITIRAKSKANVKLTAYVHMYGHVSYNSEVVEHRMERNKEYEFVWSATGAEDAVVNIHDGDMITSLGDLAPLVVETIDASKGTHLVHLKIGDAADTYRNYSLKTITLGNNTLLRTLDARNCPNLTQAVDISGCTNIEEIYFDGTSVTGLRLPAGGVIKKLHLPGTVANLTVRNQSALEEFVCPDYGNISTLWIENTPNIPTADIILAMADGGRIRLTGLDWTLDSTAILDKLVKMRGLSETGENTENAVLSGKLHFACALGVSTYLMAVERFPYLEITYDSLELDVLAEYTGKIWLTSDNKLFRLADGGYTASARGEVIDMFIAEQKEEE